MERPAGALFGGLAAGGAFFGREFAATCDFETVSGAVVPTSDACDEITENGPVFEQVAGTTAGQEHVVVFRVPVDDEMGVWRQDHLIEFAVHHALAFQTWQAMADVTSGLVERLLFDQALVIVDVDGCIGDDDRSFDAKAF